MTDLKIDFPDQPPATPEYVGVWEFRLVAKQRLSALREGGVPHMTQAVFEKAVNSAHARGYGQGGLAGRHAMRKLIEDTDGGPELLRRVDWGDPPVPSPRPPTQTGPEWD